MTDQHTLHVINMKPVHFIVMNVLSNACVALAATVVALMLDTAWALLILAFMRRPDADIVWKRPT